MPTNVAPGQRKDMPNGALPTVPDGWRQALGDNFDYAPAGLRGGIVLAPNLWGEPGLGSGQAYGLTNARWNAGRGLEATGSSVLCHTTYDPVASQWLVDGFAQGSQNSDPGAFGYHAGYGEFHVQVRMRLSGRALRGLGAHIAMRQADGGDETELVIAETPGGEAGQLRTTVRSGIATSQVTVDADLLGWRVIEMRRVYRRIAGQSLATTRAWLDGIEIGLGDALWSDSPINSAPLVFAVAGVVTAEVDETTPPDSYIEIGAVRIWTPG